MTDSQAKQKTLRIVKKWIVHYDMCSCDTCIHRRRALFRRLAESQIGEEYFTVVVNEC